MSYELCDSCNFHFKNIVGYLPRSMDEPPIHRLKPFYKPGIICHGCGSEIYEYYHDKDWNHLCTDCFELKSIFYDYNISNYKPNPKRCTVIKEEA